MTLQWLVATLHLLALPLGLGAVWTRARALRGPLDPAGLTQVFRADAAWGLAAGVWIGTGLWRAFGGLEKDAAYYVGQPLFHAKMGLLGLVLLLELWPMIALIRWRLANARGQPIDLGPARTFARISELETGLVVAMTFAATGLARGFGP